LAEFHFDGEIIVGFAVQLGGTFRIDGKAPHRKLHGIQHIGQLVGQFSDLSRWVFRIDPDHVGQKRELLGASADQIGFDSLSKARVAFPCHLLEFFHCVVR
jgi:hypothetical protein